MIKKTHLERYPVMASYVESYCGKLFKMPESRQKNHITKHANKATCKACLKLQARKNGNSSN